jgi:hypothetical protein
MSERHASAGRLGALRRWGNTPDRSAATAAARAAAEDRWLRAVRAEHPDLDDRTARLLAESRRKEFFVRLGMRSAAARRAKRGA